MNNYEVEIDGKLYRVTIEEISESQRSESKAISTNSSNENKKEIDRSIEKAEQTSTSASGNGKKVTAPMPGNVLEVLAKPGQAVQAGESVVVLEAMKMENEIVAPTGGVISAVDVRQGQSVESGDMLFEL